MGWVIFHGRPIDGGCSPPNPGQAGERARDQESDPPCLPHGWGANPTGGEGRVRACGNSPVAHVRGFNSSGGPPVAIVIPRRFLLALAVPLLAGLLGLLCVGWYVSGRIGNEALRAAYDHRPPLCDDAVVVALTDSTITLRPAADDSSRVRRGTTWGLRWRDGWGDVDTLLGASSSAVTRRFHARLGRPQPGTPVDPRT